MNVSQAAIDAAAEAIAQSTCVDWGDKITAALNAAEPFMAAGVTERFREHTHDLRTQLAEAERVIEKVRDHCNAVGFLGYIDPLLARADILALLTPTDKDVT